MNREIVSAPTSRIFRAAPVCGSSLLGTSTVAGAALAVRTI